MSLTVEKLPSDAIAQVVNAYRDAWEAVGSEGKAPNAMRAYEAAAQAFRDALASVLPRLGDAAPEPSEAEIDAAVEAIAPKHFGLQTWPAPGLTRSEIATMIRAVDRVRVDRGAASRARAPGAPTHE